MKILCLLLISSLCFAEDLDLEAGTLTISGSGSVALLIDKNNNLDTKLNLQPALGFFPIKNLNLEAHFNLLIDPSQSSQDNPLWKDGESNLWGFGIVAYYYFDIGRYFYPYIGLGGDVEWIKKEFREGSLVFPIGILLSLNSNIAINLGIPFRIHIPNYDKGISLFEIPFGYYGLKAFF